MPEEDGPPEENYRPSPQCPNCGLSIVEGRDTCPNCNTPYSLMAASSDSPVSPASLSSPTASSVSTTASSSHPAETAGTREQLPLPGLSPLSDKNKTGGRSTSDISDIPDIPDISDSRSISKEERSIQETGSPESGE